jgi:glycosyltransferase involved in cell wall biosynthesis
MSELTTSVVLALHNGERHVRAAIESVADQTSTPIELIVVDDGSTDRSIERVDDIQTPFPIRVLTQANAGQSAARNRGVEASTGDLLAFLDQDDIWHPKHLEILGRRLQDDPEVGWAYSDFDEIDGEGRLVTMSFLREHGISHPKRTLRACVEADLMVLPSASILRRRMFVELGGFDEQLRGYEDDDLYVRAFRSGWRMAFVDEPLTCFRVHANSSSTDTTFAASRLRFGQKLRESILDDRRLSRFWFRDIVAPRFLHVSLDDYVRAISADDWDAAEEAWQAVEVFAQEQTSTVPWRWKMLVLRHPRLARRLLQVNQGLPRFARPTRNPLYRLR